MLLRKFDKNYKEQVDMRAAVYRDSVDFEIVEIIRFKFDVFPNDITLVNKTESTEKQSKSFPFDFLKKIICYHFCQRFFLNIIQ